MAWTKMSTVPNPIIVDAAGTAGSGYVLKCYLPGTTTVTNIATDSTGGTTVASMTANANGKWEASGNEVIPHTDRKMKWGIFANSTDAAANTPFYMGPFDNVEQSIPSSGKNATGKDFDTLALAVADAGLSDGDVLNIKERTTGNGGGATWDVVLSSSVTENTYDVVQCTGVATLSLKLRIKNNTAYPRQFGALEDDSADDAAAIQAAIDRIKADVKTKGRVILTGPSRVSVTKGTNDKYGINIDSSNITLDGVNGATLRRLSSDISTYAKSFPILLVGKPDSNLSGDQIENIKIGKGLEFIGENTRHSTNGSALMDGRQAIWVKNTKRFRCFADFTDIDSGAIWFQKPGEYDYENSQYYNTTKCYNSLISKGDFIAQAHSTNGRALLHAIVGRMDNLRIIGNYFEWCDDCVSVSTSYDDYDDIETDTYTDSNLGQSVNRAGRGYTINSNQVLNSSEHAFYLEAMGITCHGNNITVTNQTVCDTVQYQIRGRGVSVTGGTMNGVARAGSINTGASDVTWQGTVISATGDSSGGIINIQSQGLTAYIDARSDFFGSYKAMRNIRVDVTINMPEASQTNGVGVRLYTDTTDSNFPNGQMINVNLRGTTINNPMYGVLDIAQLGRQKAYDGMIINGKPVDETYFGKQDTHDGSNNASVLSDSGASYTTNELVGYTINNLTDGSTATVTANTATTITGTLGGGTDNDWDASDIYQLIPPITSVAALAVDDSLSTSLRESSLDNNTIIGFQNILWDWGGAGSAGTIFPPAGIRSNNFKYIKHWDTAAFREPDFESRFLNNTGRFFLDRDRWFSNTSLQNSLSDTSSNSQKKSCLQGVSSSDFRWYYDDDNNYKAL